MSSVIIFGDSHDSFDRSDFHNLYPESAVFVEAQSSVRGSEHITRMDMMAQDELAAKDFNLWDVNDSPEPAFTSTLPSVGYVVEIPELPRDGPNVLEPTSGDIQVTIWMDKDITCGKMTVPMPEGAKHLHGYIIVIDPPQSLLDIDSLVSELVALYCGELPETNFSLPKDLHVGGQIVAWCSTLHEVSGMWLDHQKHIFFQQYLKRKELNLRSKDPDLPYVIYSEPTGVVWSTILPAHQLGEIKGLAVSTKAHSPAGHVNSTAMSPISNFDSPASFLTASSPASFMTARSAHTSPAMGMMSGMSPAMRIATIREEEPPDPSMPAPLQKLQDDYFVHLHRQKIVQPFDKELNWSGKGQHVTFLPKESVPLSVLSHLGASMTAKVDKVLCRRIAIARKTMRCSRQWTVADALREVYHLQNLSHSHIIQLVGTYLQGRHFSILMYPAADYHLGTFLEDMADSTASSYDQSRLQSFLLTSMGCMTSALAYVHSSTTKHMDIKPQNILVRLCEEEFIRWRIYLADFGLSRSFAPQDHSQTDGPTSRTPRYCAPEVYKYESRGRSADIFSLGCVFSEVLTVLAGDHPLDFSDFRRGDGTDESFHANLPRVIEWLCEKIPARFRACLSSVQLRQAETWLQHTKVMLHEIPEWRPSARRILQQRPAGYTWACCIQGPEPYVAYHAMQTLPQAGEASGHVDVEERWAPVPHTCSLNISPILGRCLIC